MSPIMHPSKLIGYSNMPTCASMPQTYATAQLLASHGNVLESEFYLGRELEVLDKYMMGTLII